MRKNIKSREKFYKKFKLFINGGDPLNARTFAQVLDVVGTFVHQNPDGVEDGDDCRIRVPHSAASFRASRQFVHEILHRKLSCGIVQRAVVGMLLYFWF